MSTDVDPVLFVLNLHMQYTVEVVTQHIPGIEAPDVCILCDLSLFVGL